MEPISSRSWQSSPWKGQAWHEGPVKTQIGAAFRDSFSSISSILLSNRHSCRRRHRKNQWHTCRESHTARGTTGDPRVGATFEALHKGVRRFLLGDKRREKSWLRLKTFFLRFLTRDWLSLFLATKTMRAKTRISATFGLSHVSWKCFWEFCFRGESRGVRSAGVWANQGIFVDSNDWQFLFE